MGKKWSKLQYEREYARTLASERVRVHASASASECEYEVFLARLGTLASKFHFSIFIFQHGQIEHLEN